MPSANRSATISISKDKTEKKATVPAPVGLTDSLIDDAHWQKLLTKSAKSEANLLKALTRKKPSKMQKGKDVTADLLAPHKVTAEQYKAAVPTAASAVKP